MFKKEDSTIIDPFIIAWKTLAILKLPKCSWETYRFLENLVWKQNPADTFNMNLSELRPNITMNVESNLSQFINYLLFMVHIKKTSTVPNKS